MSKAKWPLWAGLLLVTAGVLLILAVLANAGQLLGGEHPSNTATDVPASLTPEPIVPTRTPAIGTSTQVTPDPLPTATLATQQTPRPADILWQGRPRWGVGVASSSISRYDVESLRLGWYLDWWARQDPPRPGDVEYVQMIRVKGETLQPGAESIAAIAQANPGSLWLVGNEPDVKWQDNVEPAVYARLYHEAYTAIKAADPTAQVAIGGITQPTPLRLRYLDMVLASYREQTDTGIPVDVWNVHAFILREERGAWGVDIPPGLPDDQGMLYEIDDGDNMEIFRQQIVNFRRWMAERGYQGYPLIVSEYGILMPEDYGFPPERVTAFVANSFDYFLTAMDPALGYPEDGYRLVQRWCWYSLNAPEHIYPTGNLFDPETGQMTAVGEGWVEYVSSK